MHYYIQTAFYIQAQLTCFTYINSARHPRVLGEYTEKLNEYLKFNRSINYFFITVTNILEKSTLRK